MAHVHLPVTVIITVWKRLYLREQLEALANQSVLPGQVWIIHYEDHIDVMPLVREFSPLFPSLSCIRSDVNLKYFGRFSIAGHVCSEYVWLLDDDVIPGKKWLETCYEKCALLNAIISCTGRIIPKGEFVPEKGEAGDIPKYFIGDCYDEGEMNYCPADTVVDFACNSYFIQSKWIKEFWSIWPYTFLSGEDIHLSATLKIKKNIPTIVPAQISDETTGNLKKRYGSDEASSWLKPEFYDIREGVLRHMVQTHGWKPILWG